MKPLLLALVASASSAQSSTIIYTETFPNGGGTNINYNAVTWEAYRNTAVPPAAANVGDATNNTNSNFIGVANGTGQDGSLAFAFKGTATGQAHVYTTEFAPVNRSLTEIDTISFHSNNAVATDLFRVTVQIGGSWYASSQTFFRNSATAGTLQNFVANGELETFTWTTAAASWRALTSTATSLELGAVLTSDLPTGNLTGAGVLLQGATDNSLNTGTMRFDNFQIAVVPAGPPPAPVLVSLSLTDPIATEPTAASPLVGRVTLNRLDSSTRAVTVNLALTGTATSPFDYSLPTTVTLPANTNSVVIEIRPNPDRRVEPDETIIITAVSGSGYVLDPQNSATVTLQDGPFITYPTRLLNNLSAGTPQKIVVYGTSLTAGNLWPPQLKSGLDASYPGLTTLVNSGGNGQNSVWGLQNLTNRVINQTPNTVFIEFAANDAVDRLDYANRISPAEARANLNLMIDRILAPGALPDCEIILMVMNPFIDSSANPTAATARPNAVLCQQTYRDVGKERGFLVIDHMPAWQALLDQGTAAYIASTAVPDGVHPSATALQNYCTPVILREIGLTSHIPSGSVMLHASNHRTAEPPSAAGPARSTKITVTRGGPAIGGLTVPLTLGGTATHTTDYPTLPTSITIPAGASSASIEMIPTADTTIEGEETFTIAITPGPGITPASPVKASLLIQDRPFDQWRKTQFTLDDLLNPAISGDNADPDNDGIKNLLEFYTGHLPKTADPSGIATGGSETISNQNYLTLTYDRLPNTGLTGLPQTSPDLENWHSGPAHLTETILTDTGLLQTIKVRSILPIGPGNEFLRLHVTRAP